MHLTTPTQMYVTVRSARLPQRQPYINSSSVNLVPFTGTRPGHKKREESISSRVEAAAVCDETAAVREWVVRTVVKHTLDDHIGNIM